MCLGSSSAGSGVEVPHKSWKHKALGVLDLVDPWSRGSHRYGYMYDAVDKATTSSTESRHRQEKRVGAVLRLASPADRTPKEIHHIKLALARRLARLSDWKTAINALSLIHRIMRDGELSFRAQLQELKPCFLSISHFNERHHTYQPTAWYYSAWVRVYSLFLAEKLDCFTVLNYDVGREEEKNRTREAGIDDLLEHFP